MTARTANSSTSSVIETVSAAILILMLFTTLACTMTKEQCMSTYSLVTQPAVSAGPVSGPIIILTRQTGGGGWIWQVDGATQTDGGPANGVLRDDFIGDKVLKLE